MGRREPSPQQKVCYRSGNGQSRSAQRRRQVQAKELHGHRAPCGGYPAIGQAGSQQAGGGRLGLVGAWRQTEGQERRQRRAHPRRHRGCRGRLRLGLGRRPRPRGGHHAQHHALRMPCPRYPPANTRSRLCRWTSLPSLHHQEGPASMSPNDRNHVSGLKVAQLAPLSGAARCDRRAKCPQLRGI